MRWVLTSRKMISFSSPPPSPAPTPPQSWDNAWQLNCCRVVAFTLPDQSHDSSQRFRVTEIWWAMQMERTGLCNSWWSSTKKIFRLNLIFWKAENLELRSSIYLVPLHTVRSKKGPKNDQMIRDPHIICESHNQPKKQFKVQNIGI